MTASRSTFVFAIAAHAARIKNDWKPTRIEFLPDIEASCLEFNHGGSKKGASAKTNPTLVDEGEVISTGSFEVKPTETISPDVITETTTTDNEQYIIPAQGKSETKDKIIYHEVQVGETIEEIASKYGQKVSEIALLNDLEPPHYIDEFQVLKIKQTKENKKNL